MYKYDDFISDLKKAGFKSSDTVMIHSSFSSIKNIEGGAKTILDALKNYFSDGLLLLPSHTWNIINNDNDIFMKNEQNSCVGYLTNEAILDKDFIRSNHPTHSVLAYGKNAQEYILDDDYAKTPVPPNGSFGKLKYGAKILFIGCLLSKNTFVHSIEEEMNVPNRFTDHIFKFYTKDNDRLLEFNMPKHYNKACPHISDNYLKLLPVFIDKGCCRKVKILDSNSYVLDAKEVYKIVKNILAMDINAFDDERSILEYV